jgi:hypothetical protein
MNEAAGAIEGFHQQRLERILSIKIRGVITVCGDNYVIGRNNRIMGLFPLFGHTVTKIAIFAKNTSDIDLLGL